MPGPYDAILDLTVTVVADGTGAGVIRIAPAGEDWQIKYIHVQASTRVLEAVSTNYQQYIGPQYIKDATRTGSSGDTSDVVIDLNDGTPVYIVWTGGDAGTLYTANVSGTKSVAARGFRAI